MIERLLRGSGFGLIFLVCGCTSSDYCEEVKRPLTDAELIAKVVRNQAGEGRMRIDNSEKSIEAFLASSRNCCRVYRRDGLEVEMYYESSDKDGRKDKLPEHNYYEQHLVVNACGKVLRRYGMQVKDRERPCWAREEKVSSLSDTELVKAALAQAAGQMKLGSSEPSIDRFLAEHPSCCRVKRNVQDKLHPVLLNAAQVDIYYPTEGGEAKLGVEFLNILVAFNACGDFGHMYGPKRVDQKSAPTWVK